MCYLNECLILSSLLLETVNLCIFSWKVVKLNGFVWWGSVLGTSQYGKMNLTKCFNERSDIYLQNIPLQAQGVGGLAILHLI